MLAKSHRLTSNEVGHIIQKGKKYHHEFLFVRVLPSYDQKSKFGIVISAKTVPHAVDRNRIRRQTYSVIQKHTSTTPFPFRTLISYRSNPPGLSFDLIEKNMVSLLKKIHQTSST